MNNNFTTPEQSKRLLELGVPADSADLLYDNEWLEIDNDDPPIVIYKTNKFTDYNKVDYTPCWSVGRLIEIIKICSKPKEQATMSEELLYCRDLVGMLVFILEGNRSVMNFLKLEE